VEVSNRKAPKREVLAISKKGSWGNYEYAHQLECGHTEFRKRVAPTSKSACRLCVKAEIKDKELKELVLRAPEPVTFDDDLIPVEEDNLVEVEAGSLRGALAASLGVPAEAVDVVVSDVDGRLVISSVVVFLSGLDAKRIAKIL